MDRFFLTRFHQNKRKKTQNERNEHIFQSNVEPKWNATHVVRHQIELHVRWKWTNLFDPDRGCSGYSARWKVKGKMPRWMLLPRIWAATKAYYKLIMYMIDMMLFCKRDRCQFILHTCIMHKRVVVAYDRAQTPFATMLNDRPNKWPHNQSWSKHSYRLFLFFAASFCCFFFVLNVCFVVAMMRRGNNTTINCVSSSYMIF